MTLAAVGLGLFAGARARDVPAPAPLPARAASVSTPLSPQMVTPAPVPGSATRWAFAVWGDVRADEGSTSVSSGFKKVVAGLDAFTFPAAVAVGDYIYADGSGSGDKARYASFLSTSLPLRSGRVTHWVIGNHERMWDPVDHELYHSQIWSEAVPAGDPATHQRHHWGSFFVSTRGQRIQFFYLSTCESDDGEGSIGFKTATVSSAAKSAWRTQSAQARALVRWLRSRPAKAWAVVTLHHPLYDAKIGDPYDTTTAGSEKMRLVKLFHRYGVDLVLQGDVHNYRRHVQPDGSVYLTQGMGGARPDPASSTSSATDVPHLDSRDRGSLGSPSASRQRCGWTLFRMDDSGRLRAATYYVSTLPETVSGVTYAAGDTILLERFKLTQVKRAAR